MKRFFAIIGISIAHFILSCVLFFFMMMAGLGGLNSSIIFVPITIILFPGAQLAIPLSRYANYFAPDPYPKPNPFEMPLMLVGLAVGSLLWGLCVYSFFKWLFPQGKSRFRLKYLFLFLIIFASLSIISLKYLDDQREAKKKAKWKEDLHYIQDFHPVSPTTPEIQLAISQARDATSHWLPLIDAKQYIQSWNEGSTKLKKDIPQDRWKDYVSSSYLAYGPMKSRQEKSAELYRTTPTDPADEYVIIKNRGECDPNSLAAPGTASVNAIETIQLVKENDGSWRVSKYSFSTYPKGSVQYYE